MGEKYLNKYIPISTEAKTGSKPLGTVLSLWFVFAIMCLFGAETLFADVAFDDRVRGRSILLPILESNLALAEPLGLPALKRQTDQIALAMNNTPVLWEATEESAPPRLAEMPGSPKAGPTKPATATPKGDQAWTPHNGLPSPKRILLIGASSVQFYLGADLERKLEGFENVKVHRLGKLSTGLTRPDVFDWPAKLRELKKKFKPDLVVALFGGNDCQPAKIDGKVRNYATKAWNQWYLKRFNNFVSIMREGGTAAVILGMPTMRSKKFSAKLKKLNEVFKEGCDQAGCVFIPTWDLTADHRGRYKKSLKYKGDTALMRLKDGIHYSRHGSRYVSDKLLARFQRHFNLVSEEREQALVARFQLQSKALGKSMPYLSFVPQGTKDKLPLLLLLHGRDGNYADWSNHAHESIGKLATQHQMVIVTPEAGARSWYLDSPLKKDQQTETYLIEELLPELSRQLPISDQRTIVGLSMGGHGALGLSIRRPGLFKAAGSMSGVLNLTTNNKRVRRDLNALLGPYKKNKELWRQHSVRHLVETVPKAASKLPMRITVGKRDRYRKANRALHRLLTKLKIDHEYAESKGGHDWKTWVAELPKHLAFVASHLPKTKNPKKGVDSAWHRSAELGQLKRLKQLLAEGAKLDATNRDGDTALHLAAARGHVRTVGWLCSQKVNLAAKNKRGATALHEAARKGQVEALRKLITYKAPLDALDKRKRTALHWSARYGFSDASEWLLIAGARYDKKDADGKLPQQLGFAFTKGRFKQLIEQAKERQAAKKIKPKIKPNAKPKVKGE